MHTRDADTNTNRSQPPTTPPTPRSSGPVRCVSRAPASLSSQRIIKSLTLLLSLSPLRSLQSLPHTHVSTPAHHHHRSQPHKPATPRDLTDLRGAPLGGGELSQVDHALGVAPLVIVPRHHLDQVVAHHHGERGVDGGGDVGAQEVAGHQGLVAHGEDALHGAGGGLAEGVVDLLRRGLLLHLDAHVHHGHVGGGHAQRDAVELALELGEDEGHRLGGAGGGGHDVEGGGAGAAEVAVGRVEDALVARVGVGGGHEPLDDAELRVDHLDEGRQAVGGAGRVGDDLVAVLVVVVVDAHDVRGDVVALGRRRDDHLLGARLQVLGRARGVNEHPGALDHQLHAQLLPGQLGGVAARHDLDHLAVDGDVRVVHHLHHGVERAEDGVVLHQVGRLLDTAGVVDGDDVQVGGLAPVPAAQEVAPDAPEAVDGHLHLRLGDGVDGGSLDDGDGVATGLESCGRAAELDLEGRGGLGKGGHFSSGVELGGAGRWLGA
mmetsp:Transcript_24577/g.60396  ORF Transcript_24577/g.60396 Transcript_24577/m.60396 type:complete len:490 (-) Transcript_24577:33-1502(-)